MSKKLIGKQKQNARRKLNWQKNERTKEKYNEMEKNFVVKPPEVNKDVRVILLKVERLENADKDSEELNFKASAEPHFGFEENFENFRDEVGTYEEDLGRAFESMGKEMLDGDFDNLTGVLFYGLKKTKQGVQLPVSINGVDVSEITKVADIVMFDNLMKTVKDDGLGMTSMTNSKGKKVFRRAA